MVDFNNNVLYQAKQIFFKSNKIFILNLLSFLVIALLFAIGQHYFQKKNNLLNKHTVIIENVPIIPTNDKVIKTENLKINYRIVSKTYPENDFQVFDVYGRLFDNSDEQISEMESGVKKFVRKNLQKQVEKMDLTLKVYKNKTLNDPLEEMYLSLRKNYLKNINFQSNYYIQRNNFNQIISRSFIYSFIIILTIRIFINEFEKLNRKKSQKK